MKKIQKVINRELHFNSKLDEAMPRSSRHKIKTEIENVHTLILPSLSLSNRRSALLVGLTFFTSLILLLLSFKNLKLFVISLAIVRFTFYALLAILPATIIHLSFPRFFSPLDWPKTITTVGDLIDVMVLRNWSKYYANNCKLLMDELITPQSGSSI